MRGKLSNVVALALACVALCAAAGATAAQDSAGRPQAAAPQPPRAESPGAAPSDAENADLSITARVTARELLFRKVPNPRVEFTGRPRRDTVWEAERENLPAEVQPGVTYRDIGITLRITSVFADIDRIVAEALGEIPLSDDTPPTPPAPATEKPEGPAVNSEGPRAVSSSTPAPAARRRPAPRRGRVR